MKIGLSTLLSPESQPEDCIKIAEETNLDYIEIFFDLPQFSADIDEKRIETINEKIKLAGLKSRVHARLWDLNPTSQYSEIRKLSKEKSKQSIRICSLLDGDTVTIHPGRCWILEKSPESSICTEWFEDYIEGLTSYTEELEINLAIETGSHQADYPTKAKNLIDLTKEKKNLGVTLDVGHVFLSTENGEKYIVNLIETLKNQIKNVHLHDNDGHSDLHLPPGSGKIKFHPILETLKKYYDGPIILELWDPKKPESTAKRGIKELRKILSEI